MNYSDLQSAPGIRATTQLGSFYDLTYPAARAVLQACHEAFAAGSVGLPEPKHVASRDLLSLVHDAWHDGIVGRKLTVRLDSDTEGGCSECGSSVSSCDEQCGDCGSEAVNRMVVATVDAPFADVWADWNQSIDGSSWETPSDMPHMAYTTLFNRLGLVEDLRNEGFALDLSNYEAP